jgi:phospholipid/cholesterol/gamma-HCH transport system ATP-binding protein
MNIEVRQLYRSFGSREVLRGVDMAIDSGGIHVILGGSGTGKSVLLKHMIGLLKPDSGQVFIDGRDITRLSDRQLYPVRQRMSFIFQGAALLNSLSVGQNVGLALSENTRMTRREIDRVVDQKLEMVGLAGRAGDRPSNMSGGQQKRVAIARALASSPEVLFYDEPTAGLDPPTAATIDKVIRQVADATKVTSVIVTHDMISVFEVAEKIHMMHQGRVIFEGTSEELLRCELLEVRQFLKRDCSGARLAMLGNMPSSLPGDAPSSPTGFEDVEVDDWDASPPPPPAPPSTGIQAALEAVSNSGIFRWRASTMETPAVPDSPTQPEVVSHPLPNPMEAMDEAALDTQPELKRSQLTTHPDFDTPSHADTQPPPGIRPAPGAPRAPRSLNDDDTQPDFLRKRKS